MKFKYFITLWVFFGGIFFFFLNKLFVCAKKNGFNKTFPFTLSELYRFFSYCYNIKKNNNDSDMKFLLNAVVYIFLTMVFMFIYQGLYC